MSKIQLLATGPEFPPQSAHTSLPHVLFIVDGFPKALGGGERIVLRLAAMLPRYGFRASILTLALHPESSFRPAEAPCPVYLLPLTNTFGRRAFLGAIALARFVRREKVQVVQTFFESSDLWAGLVVRLLSPAKLIWSRRDMGILRGKKHSLAYRALRNLPHAVFAVSSRVAEHVTVVDGVPASRVRVVHNGLDLDTSVRPRSLPVGHLPVITTIGNIRRVKGHDILIEAIPHVLALFPSAKFTIAGEVLEHDFFGELQRKVEELGVSEHVSFVGRITDQRKHLAGADIFVLPSRSEGFSNALIEAMAAGLPSVATDVGGNSEAIQSGISGLIIPAEDSASLAKAILCLLGDPAYAQGLSIAGQQAVTERFSSDGMLRTVSGAYRCLLTR